jgi:hypothetical protein
MRVPRIIRFIARGAVALPLFAFGHSSEFLDAKFYFDDSGIAHIEITADYGGNPMLSNQDEAAAALRVALAGYIGEKERPLSEFAPVVIAPRDKPDPDSPMPSGPVDPKTPHQLLTASWQWRPNVESLSFIVPKESNQTLIFWMKEKGIKEPRWKMLMPGESTPPIAVPPRPAPLPWVFALILVPLAVLSLRRS